jgi:hypothetical protein
MYACSAEAVRGKSSCTHHDRGLESGPRQVLEAEDRIRSATRIERKVIEKRMKWNNRLFLLQLLGRLLKTDKPRIYYTN